MGKVLSYSYENGKKEIHVNKKENKDKEENFEDMEENQEDIYVGIGIKRMKAYKCDLKINELNSLREHFWKVKTNHNNKNWLTWDTIKRAVSFDELRASILLEEYQIKPVNGCINYLMDSKGNYYKIPNYMINEPYFEKKIEDEKNVKEEKMNIKIYGYKNLELEINNKSKGKDLKLEIKTIEKIGDEKKIRLFYKGTEIKDEDFLFNHDINGNNPVMLLVQ